MPAERQHGPDADLLTIAIGGDLFTDHVLTETRPLIDAEQAGDAARHPAENAANQASDRPGGFCALPGALCRTTDDSLSLGR